MFGNYRPDDWEEQVKLALLAGKGYTERGWLEAGADLMYNSIIKKKELQNTEVDMEVNGIILPEEGDPTGGWVRRRVFLISQDQVMVVLEYREQLGTPWLIADLKRFKRDEVEAAVECLKSSEAALRG